MTSESSYDLRELIWSGFGYVSGLAGNFHPGRLHGEDVIFVFEGSSGLAKYGHYHGYIKVLSSNYETISEVRGGNYALIDVHEFNALDEKTALVSSYRPIPYDLKAYRIGPRSQWITEEIFQEIDVKTGTLIFEWSSLDHVLPDECARDISSLAWGTGHNSSDAVDYFHINSVDRDDDGNYLVSGRHTSSVYLISKITGAILWRLSGKFSNFTLGAGVSFGLQYHTRFISSSKGGQTITISLFDTSGHPTNSRTGEYINKSTAKILSLNTKTWKAVLIQRFLLPDDVFSWPQGGILLLPNENALVNRGGAGAIIEFSSNGTVLYHAYLDTGRVWTDTNVQNYRAYKSNWNGIPNEEPAIVALKYGESTMIYVSWNGDTETMSWRFYGVDETGKETLLGQEERAGFETRFYVKSGTRSIEFVAEALEKKGRVLRRSRAVGIEPYIYQYVPGRDDFSSSENERQYVLENFEHAPIEGLEGHEELRSSIIYQISNVVRKYSSRLIQADLAINSKLTLEIYYSLWPTCQARYFTSLDSNNYLRFEISS